MSLYFNWSCDFQRFTKSKKLSKFQVRTTTFVLLNKSLSTSLFNLQGTICCFALVSELFSSSTLADSLFSIPQYAPNVNTFLQLFSKKFYMKFVHSIYTYIIYSSCPNVLKIKHHLPLYTDNRWEIMQHTIFPRIFQYSVVIIYHILLTFIPYFLIFPRKLCATLCHFSLYTIYIAHTKKTFSFY